MSTNIDSAYIVYNNNARISARDLLALDEKNDRFPEANFLEKLIEKAEKLLSKSKKCLDCKSPNETDALFCKRCGIKLDKNSFLSTDINITHFHWYGEGSGWAFDFLINEVAPKIMGEIHVVFQWEGGNGASGLAIKDGRVIQPEVVQALKMPEDW